MGDLPVGPDTYPPPHPMFSLRFPPLSASNLARAVLRRWRFASHDVVKSNAIVARNTVLLMGADFIIVEF